MRFGLLLRPGQANLVTPGFDYLEDDVTSLLKPAVADEQFHPFPGSNPAVRAVHSLIPDLTPIVGPEVDLPALRLYVQRACERAAKIGVRVVNLNSPGAMWTPEGVDAKQAKSQVLEFLRTALPFFARHELMLVAGVNPTDRSNVMTTLPEVMQYVWQVDHPWFQCLLDVGLVMSGVVTTEQVSDALPWVRHVYAPLHLPRPRHDEPAAPLPDMKPAFALLKSGGYRDFMTLTPTSSAPPLDEVKAAWAEA